MKEFTYVEPATLKEACEFLHDHGEESKILGGGCSLTLLLKQGLVTPTYIVSIGKIAGLDSLERKDGELRIGAMVTHRTLELSEQIGKAHPVLAQMASHVGHVQVRNLGTIGGNLCHADHRADPPALLVALGARIRLTSMGGTRTLAVEDFIEDYYLTRIEPDEILTEIIIPDLPSSSCTNYLRFSPRSTMEEPVVAVATVAVAGPGGDLEEVRLALGAVAPKPFRVPEAEEMLTQKSLDEAAMKESAVLASRAADPLDDVYGPAEWKREMVRVHVYRALRALRNDLSLSP